MFQKIKKFFTIKEKRTLMWFTLILMVVGCGIALFCSGHTISDETFIVYQDSESSIFLMLGIIILWSTIILFCRIKMAETKLQKLIEIVADEQYEFNQNQREILLNFIEETRGMNAKNSTREMVKTEQINGRECREN